MKIASLGLGLLCLSLLTACPPQEITQIVNVPLPSANPSVAATPDPTAQAVIQAIHDNANTLNGDDITKYWATLHVDSDFSKGMPALYTSLRNSRVQYNIIEAKIQSQSADIASAIVKRRTSDFTGTVEQEVLYTLRTDKDGKWKIYSMVTQSQHYI